ncbi:MAG: hypothetical protein IJC68_00060 [Firmicutes bacterium]|nr:hypothetical protein [Bacillota bacterium]
MNIREYMKDHILVADGALGPLLQKYGRETGPMPDSIQIERPELLERM